MYKYRVQIKERNSYIMDQILPYFFPLFLFPGISLFFFNEYFRLSWKWNYCFLYLFLNTGLILAELSLPLPGGLWLLPEACLLALSGSLALHYPFRKAVPFSTLICSVLSVCQGVVQCMVFWYVAKLSPQVPLLKYMDFIQFLLTAVLFSLLLFFVVKAFPLSAFAGTRRSFLLMVIPILFISLTERTIGDSVYGSVTIWDKQLGIVYPVVEHTEILFLQLFAGICLFAILFLWKAITNSILLEQQLHAQELYLKEVCSRYEETRSFRHDIKNHLTVIRELLNAQEFQEAGAYLSHLDMTADSLSCPVHTGRHSVDALLGSKLALAAQYHIKSHFELLLPHTEEISDMDWCILFANALDNAIHANQLVPLVRRMLKICGSQKGNLYLLSIENACQDTSGRLPKESTGLSNIRAIVKKHGGTVRITLSQNCFRLDILLVIP